MKEWVLREEVLAVTHRWPLIVVFFIVGSLLGWLVAFIWPSPYRATTEIYVGLDPFRAVENRYVANYANAVFRFPDDYKFWQMSQLNALVFLDEYLQETLAKLRAEDSYWDGVEIPELRERLSVRWRDPGKWRLVAEDVDPKHAAQAVTAWREVVFTKTSLAIASSQELFRLDIRLQEISAAQLDCQARMSAINDSKASLLQWREALLQSQDRAPLETLERWRLWSVAARAADLNWGWQSLLESMPAPEAPRQAYVAWIDQAVTAIDQESWALQARLAALEEENLQAVSQWEAAYHQGWGLAATMLIERPGQAAPDVVRASSPGLAALVGGVLGLLAWVLWVLARLTLEQRR